MNILVVGDIMVDKYVHVSTERNAPESGLPVWDEEALEYSLGGAANVAVNVKELIGDSGTVTLVGILGSEYEFGNEHCTSLGLETEVVMVGPTMFKTRYVTEVDGKQKFLLRHDSLKRFQDWNLTLLKSHLARFMDGKKFDAVIFSDYDKGTIDREVFELCGKSELVVVDSKRKDLRLFSGATVLKLNESEFAAQVSQRLYDSVESLFKFVVVTKGAKPTQLRVFAGDFHHQPRDNGKWLPSWNRNVTSNVYSVHSIDFPVEKAEVVDVTGCGDTHVAAMTVSLVHGNDINHAIRYANAAARDVVQRFGTSVPEGI
jgi:bifunctional ADP-heptose synthase (sugar kinase/adenylyltransferase)